MTLKPLQIPYWVLLLILDIFVSNSFLPFDMVVVWKILSRFRSKPLSVLSQNLLTRLFSVLVCLSFPDMEHFICSLFNQLFCTNAKRPGVIEKSVPR